MSLFALDPVSATFLAIWFLLIGACIGSFLNVVVYRLPLRENLSKPPSHCPKCQHPIRWYDNVPVFGWLMLRGRCRDCKEPISFRYPMVEAITGLVFGSIAFALLTRDCTASQNECILFASVLSVLVVTLLAAGLIQWDDYAPVPWQLFVPLFLLGPMIPWLCQESFQIPLFVPWPYKGGVTPPIWPAMFFGFYVLVSSLFGTVSAILVRRQPFLKILVCVMIGGFLGHESVFALVFAVLLSLPMGWILRRKSDFFFLCLATTVFAAIMLLLVF